MLRKGLFIAVILMLVFSASQAFAEYKTGDVIKVMRGNVKLMGQLKRAIADKDSFAAADAFMSLARGSNSIKGYTPKRGSARDWKATHEGLIKAAFRGIGALATDDWDGANKAFGEIAASNKRGHSNHK
jgi:hypothetical protein